MPRILNLRGKHLQLLTRTLPEEGIIPTKRKRRVKK
jgi:hypothetical protein